MFNNHIYGNRILIQTPAESGTNIGNVFTVRTGEAYFALIKKGEDIFTYNGGWIKISTMADLTAEHFRVHGMESMTQVPVEKFQELGDFQVLMWTSVMSVAESKILTERDVPEDITLEMNISKTSGVDILNREEEFNILTSSDAPIKTEVERLNNTEVRYQISVDETSWYGYDGTWSQSKLMTKEEVALLNADILSMLTSDEIYAKENFFIKSILTSDNPEVYPTVQKVKFTFVENKEPVIQNLSISFGEQRGEKIKTEFFARDKEGDKMQYFVYIKKASKFEFEPISTEWTPITQERNEFYFDFSTLIPGRNEVKVEVKDSRGLVGSASGYIMLINNAPFNLATYHDSAKVTGVIQDPEGDLVTYDIYLDGELIREGTDYLPQPRTFHYEWPRNKIVPGKFYQVKMVFKDIFGARYETQFKIVGAYRGIMFSNEFGYYYTDDKLNLLEWLQMGEVNGGEYSEVKRVYIENHCGFPAKNVTIEAGPTRSNALASSLEGEDIINSMDVELSLKESPFEPLSSVTIPRTMPLLTREPFFVRVKAKAHARESAEFRLKASARDGSI